MKITKRIAKEVHNEKGKSFDEGYEKGKADAMNKEINSCPSKEEIDIMIKEMLKLNNKTFIQLLKWLYDNYRPILREWEATKGNLQIEFLSEEGKE